jgi:uncharacterized membrane protein
MRSDVLHPLFVHLHIALLFMAFITMYYWLFKGMARATLSVSAEGALW